MKDDANIIYFMLQEEIVDRKVDWTSLSNKMSHLSLQVIMKSCDRLKELVPLDKSKKDTERQSFGCRSTFQTTSIVRREGESSCIRDPETLKEEKN